ncbi:hypothetical protein JTE90_022199 [Oedothorax gibbosus]|uniref:Apple domain-containing protein n=1 Tax=Oedothorax gibbosus TaxID=931172 RepID=A0AAV6VPG8_9ARAC|nr:hypothetical protein JTE90_022199 [Oedothorax gibbosus]
MSHSKSLWSPIFLFLIPLCCGKDGLYRLIDRDTMCDELSVMQRLSAYSLSTCATACKLKKSCGMFSLKHVYDNSTLSSEIKPKKNVKLECALCKTSNMTSVIEKKGWSMYMKYLKEAKFHILDTDNKPSAPDVSPLEIWNIDCNSPEITTKRNGAIIGIWDDKDAFKDLDKVKCFNWDAADLFSDKPSRLLYIYLEDYRQCPKDYVLTAITASNAAFRNVDNGKCTPLAEPFHIDYERCVTVNSEGRDGGSVDKWRPWNVQCPTTGPHVAVSLLRRMKIHTGLKCCVLKGISMD